MWNRVLAVFRAGFGAHWRGADVPVAPLVVHGSVAAALALLVGDSLPPYAYALFMLSLALGLIALPLLGDFGFLLRADPAREWIEAQPVRAIELRLARTMILLVLVMTLAGAALLPIAVFAPSSMGVGARVALFAAGLALGHAGGRRAAPRIERVRWLAAAGYAGAFGWLATAALR